MKSTFLIFVFVLLATMISAQTPSSDERLEGFTYYEPLENGMIRLYLDQHYYLTDRDCIFLSIERDAKFDLKNKVFDGEFFDYDLNGNLILSGHYVQGKKEGLFQAYHTNGQLKWSVSYKADQPEGQWMYYYADGKPMLDVFYGNRGMEIRNYWDLKGGARVEEGKGRYEMNVEIDGYSEYGANYVHRRGRIVNGKPNGAWTLSFVFPENKREFIGIDTYREGRLEKDQNETLEYILRGNNRQNLLPVNWFYRAEELIGKDCSIDQQSGFIMYLSDYLENWFEEDADRNFRPVKIVYNLHVNKDGALKKLEPVETFLDSSDERMLSQAIASVTYWFPSFFEGDYIDDELNLSFEIFPDSSGKLRFLSLQIDRKKGI